jgi:CheY-like chemotaxis protein
MFAQRQETLHRAQGGLGIGLSLVKNLVDLHGGSVEVRSSGSGLGSEFVLRLPRRVTAPATQRSDAGAARRATSERKHRILIVDDNLDAAESLSLLLGGLGHDVRMAHDGPTAIDLALAERPAVVLLDVRLPGMSGYDVCRRLREEGMRDTLMVAVTGFGREQDRSDSRAAGCDAHIVKPVKLEDLLAVLNARN